MIRSLVLAAALAAVCATTALAAPAASARTSDPYAHATQVEAQREAFWRSHRAISASDPQTDARKQRYWTAQSRSRFNCLGYGGC